MSAERRRRPPPRKASPDKPHGLLMAVLGTALIVYCIFGEIPLENLPFILIGALFVILYEFHPRIHGRIGLGKLHASVVSDQSGPGQPNDPTDLRQWQDLRNVNDPQSRSDAASHRRR